MSFVKNSAYLAIANFFQLLSAYVLNVWVGRFLGPADFGRYVIILSIFGVMNVFLTGGSSQAIAKVVAEDKRSAAPVTAQLLKWGVPALVLLAAIYYFVISVLISSLLHDNELLFHIRLLTPIIPLFGIGAIYAGNFIGREQFGLQTIKLILVSIGKMALTVILTLYFLVSGAIAALSLTGFIGIIFSLFFIRANPT